MKYKKGKELAMTKRERSYHKRRKAWKARQKLKRISPYAGIVIDPFSTTMDEAGRYPRSYEGYFDGPRLDRIDDEIQLHPSNFSVSEIMRAESGLVFPKPRKSGEKDLFENSGAEFSDCGNHRFALWRIWDSGRPLVMFIGLNPSKAGADIDDPTIRRVRTISYNLKYGGFYMMNLFSFITPYPEHLITHDYNNKMHMAINDEWLKHVAFEKCKDIIFAWGNFKISEERANQVRKMFPQALALQINKNGSPKHPLYVKQYSTCKL